MNKEVKLEVNNLKISFRTDAGKVQAVRDISFNLYKGETLAIVGESGSGKSVTNRAIIGILANNAIVESGEIIYDGKDLLKISEEEFHKIRGDKIAMIFQDPMSSLNPIMRVGKQLTEAMLLKGKASQKNARRLFNNTLSILHSNMDAIAKDEAEKKSNDKKCHTLDEFCINSARLERNYNAIHRAAEELKIDIENTLFLHSKKQPFNYKKFIRSVTVRINETIHPDIVVMNDQLKGLLNVVSNSVSNVESGKGMPVECVNALEKINEILDFAVKRPEPNYFTLGYYMMRNPEANLDDMPIDELTAMTRKYLDDEFMLDFIERGSKAIAHSREISLEKKKNTLPAIDKIIEIVSEDEIDSTKLKPALKELVDDVEEAINKLEIVKNNVEYTFKTSIKVALEKYFYATVNNPKEQTRFEKQSRKMAKLVGKGKELGWQVVPASIIDLELQRKEILQVLYNLKSNYERQLAATEFDDEKDMVAIIDYLKEQASAFVYTVTKKLAKAKALKLMEEVGIPEPAIRYKQYPFEFSGGMRQRIVIAIALAANPDILICDEPTTALDVTIQAQILELINKLKKERNLSVIFITHDLGVVANMADRIAVMYAGKIVETGTADDVFYDPRHPYTWALLSSMPDLDTNEKLDAIPGTPPNMIYPPKGDAFAARNKYAMEIDYERQPPMFRISDTHYAATWLLHPNAPKIMPPKQVTDRIERMKNLGGGN